MKNIFTLFSILTLICISVSISASGNLPMAKIEIAPLPTLKVTSISDLGYEGNIPMATMSGSPESIPLTMVGSQIDIPGLEDQIMDHLEQMDMAAASAVTPTGSFGSWMVTIGSGNASGAARKAQKIVDKALEIGRYVDALTGGNIESMPIIKKQMIGNNELQIIFNSAKIYPNYAEIEVYIKITMDGRLDFEGKPVELYFGADNILFSKDKGVIKGSVGLLADYSIKLGESTDAGLWLTKMEKVPTAGQDTPLPLDDEFTYSGTFINFDCDGFREMGIGGRLIFSRDWVIPTNDIGEPIIEPNGSPGNTPRVNGEINITAAQDFDDIMIDIDIQDPFVLTAWQDMSFQLSGASIDLSASRNPTALATAFPGQTFENDWEGVYIKTVAITLPEPFKRSSESFANTNQTNSNTPPASGTAQNNPNYAAPTTERMKVAAEHLRIDDGGLTGNFQLTGQAPLVGGAVMDGEWGWSLETIGIELEDSDFVGFNFAGELGVPILSKKSPLDYTAYFNFGATNKYKFTLAIPADKPLEIPVWNAAQISIVEPKPFIEVIDGEFSGGITFKTVSVQIGNPADYQQSSTGSILKMPGLTIHQMALNTRGTFLTVGGVDINGGDSKVSNFPVNISELTVGSSNTNPEEVKIGFSILLNLMDSGSSGVEASGSVNVIGEYVRDIDGTRSWKYKDLQFAGAQITASFPQFYGTGTLHILRNDPVYGNGFSAKLDAGIMGNNMSSPADGKFQLKMASIFGSMDEYRYFMVDGFIGGFDVPLFGPFSLDGFGGGVFHHMKPSAYVGDGDGNTPAPPGVSLSGIQYKPTKGTKLGIKFTTSITTTGGLMNGLLTGIIRFDQNMALQNITFWGTADIMLRSDLTDKITASADKFIEKIPDVVKPVAEIKAKNQNELDDNDAAADNPDSGVKAKLGISLDFVDGLSFHAFGDVSINIGDNLLKGSGTIDMLLDPASNDWHYYLGGYYQNDQGISIQVPDFFDDSKFITLSPVSAAIDYGGFNVQASMYFLAGTKIPGPPPAPPEVAQFFADEGDPVKDNRNLLTCEGRDPAMGTGIAFGASAFLTFDKKFKGFFGSCFPGMKVSVIGGVGFDLAFLKYAAESQCPATGASPHGINGFRATGRVYTFVEIKSGHVLCFPIPPLGFGVKVEFDVPNPSFFEAKCVLKVGKKWRFTIPIGDQCGSPCNQTGS